MAMLTDSPPKEESRETASRSPAPPSGPRPPNRDVARPVANLGNTCYMNAVLQALAHAPELCTAMDVQPHHINCPIYRDNVQKRRSSPSSSPDGMAELKLSGTRKSRRSSGKKSPTNAESDDAGKFCALCEVELHLIRVHSISSNRDRPVAPSLFVNGFIRQVAPWFKLGQQEDSHEFLRLLIDAMQRSCKQARSLPEDPEDNSLPETNVDNDHKENVKPAKNDREYSFQLFRGLVESNVTCESCKSTSSTTDPIEDIGLDVTPTSGSSSSSPTPYLADVSTALQRFARAEALDSGYKCENCGKVGRATKQSRLASIPPILTLHLKRFRYGETQASAASNHRRSNRASEVSQLLNSDYFGGKSGSAKIEGHSKFKQVLDLKPYLTEEMQAKHSKMFCRLFSVIVHAGKNSHSGHYICYVRNIAKNEWWKMDDARITIVSMEEVMNAEAYMLFYRVVDHPFAIRLREQQHELTQAWKKEDAQEAAQEAASISKTTIETISKEELSVPHSTDGTAPVAAAAKLEDLASVANSSLMSSVRTNNSRKRKAPEFTCGEDWALAKTNIPKHLAAQFREVENYISDYVQFKPEFCKFLLDQAGRRNARVGHGPSSGICEDDIQDGTGKIKRVVLELFFSLHKAYPNIFRKRSTPSTIREKVEASLGVLTSSLVDPDEDPLL